MMHDATSIRHVPFHMRHQATGEYPYVHAPLLYCHAIHMHLSKLDMFSEMVWNYAQVVNSVSSVVRH